MKVANVTPDFDTCRIYLPCYVGKLQVIYYYQFFKMEFSKEVASFQKMHNEDGTEIINEDGTPKTSLVWERKRADMKKSWWCKMQITQETLKYGKKGSIVIPCICCEFSISKWFNYTNGINRGCLLDPYEIIIPVVQCLKKLHILNYTPFDNWGTFLKYVYENIILRRIDISYNFKTLNAYETLKILATLRINNKNGNLQPSEVMGDYSSVSFGITRGSNYKITFYNKFEEQKKLFSRFDIDNTEEERESKKKFWKNNKHLFENVVRFEIQYNSKYFLNQIKDYKYRRGVKMIEKIINLCEGHWQKMLNQIDEQLGMENIRTDKETTLVSQALENLDKLEMLGQISTTQRNNLQGFLQDCYKKGYKDIWVKYGKDNFGKKYRTIKKLVNFDVKRDCLYSLPIMRIIETDSYKYKCLKNFCLMEYKPIILQNVI